MTAVGGALPVDRRVISREMDDARAQLHELIGGSDPADLRRRSDGTRWTNEQLLFHMVFGYLVVRVLLWLVRVVSRLPAPVGRGWAALLNSARRPFHVVNYWGSVGGARVFNHARMGRLPTAPSPHCSSISSESRRQPCTAACRFRPAGTPTSPRT